MFFMVKVIGSNPISSVYLFICKLKKGSNAYIIIDSLLKITKVTCTSLDKMRATQNRLHTRTICSSESIPWFAIPSPRSNLLCNPFDPSLDLLEVCIGAPWAMRIKNGSCTPTRLPTDCVKTFDKNLRVYNRQPTNFLNQRQVIFAFSQIASLD